MFWASRQNSLHASMKAIEMAKLLNSSLARDDDMKSASLAAALDECVKLISGRPVKSGIAAAKA